MSTSSIPPKPVARSNGRRTHKKRWLWVAVAGLLLLLLAGGWVLSIRAAAKSIKADAAIAQTQLRQSKAALTAGDLPGAAAAAALAEHEVAAAQHIADSLPVRALGWVPYVGGVVSDLNHLIAAARDAAGADTIVVNLYGKVSGKADGTGILVHKHVDFVELRRAGIQVTQIDVLLNAAIAELHSVRAKIPGTHSLAHARDSALAEIVPLESSIRRIRTLWPSLARAFGATGPRNYLVVIQNPAELFPGGGASLAAAIIRFDHGVMTTPVKGSVSSTLFPNNPIVSWVHEVGQPYFVPGYSPGSFAWSGEHPDFRLSAIEMLRAWQAHTGLMPDAVIAIDPVALAAVLRATGPLQSPVYGTITADNLVQKVLVQGYQRYGQNRDARHDVNQLLMDAMFARLSSGHGLLKMMVELSSTAPARHFRVYMADSRLQTAIVSAGWAGYMTQTSGDLIDAFSLDQNANKVSVFQKREIAEQVTLTADGGALITRVVTVTNDAPQAGFNPADRIGLTTRWAYNHYDIFLPRRATVVARTASMKNVVFRQVRDVEGWVIVRMSNWLAPGQTLRMTVTFSVPPGTFSQPSGALAYAFVAEPQPMITVTGLQVAVTAPSGLGFSPAAGWIVNGDRAIFSAPVDRTVSPAVLPFG